MGSIFSLFHREDHIERKGFFYSPRTHAENRRQTVASRLWIEVGGLQSNVAGQKIDTVFNDFLNSGNHSVVWDASSFSAGVYFYTVKSGDHSKTMKMTYIK